VSTGTISLAYRSADVVNPLKGYGLVIPMSERRPINAVTLSSVKFAHRAPEGYLLLRVFFGGSRSPQSMELDDGELYTMVRRELDALLGITPPSRSSTASTAGGAPTRSTTWATWSASPPSPPRCRRASPSPAARTGAWASRIVSNRGRRLPRKW
jgi:hypothetical protein